MLLLDPLNITIDTAGVDLLTPNPLTFATNPTVSYTLTPATITAIANAGTAVTLQAEGDITVNSSIIVNNATGNGGALTFTAGRSILVNADIVSDNGNITLNANHAGATSAVAGTANFTNTSHIDAGSGDITVSFGLKNAVGSIATGFMSAKNLTVNSDKTTLTGPLALGQTVVDSLLKIYSGGTAITNDSGVVINIGSTLSPGSTVLDACNTAGNICGDITLNNPATNLNEILFKGNNITLVDTNAVQIGASSASGNFSISTYGPMKSTGALLIGGTTSITELDGGFGTATPFLDLPHANHFGGTFNANIATGYASINDTGGMTLGNLTVGTSLAITAGGAITQTGNLNTGTSLSVTNAGSYTQTGNITTGSNMSVNAAGSYTQTGTVNASSMSVTTSASGLFTQAGKVTAGSMSVNAAGAVTLAEVALGNDLSVTAGGAITQVSATKIVAPRQTTLTATAAYDITLNNSNDFNGVHIVSGKNVTLNDSTALVLGNVNGGNANSTVAADLSVTAGGTISQNDWNATAYQSALTVTGTTTFTITSADSDLLIGPISGYGGQANSLTGVLSILKTGAGGYRDVQVRNTYSGASTITGLSGSFRNVGLIYNNAASLAVPGMTLSGTLTAMAPQASITQSGALTVAGVTRIEASAAAGKSVALDNVNNDFSSINVTTGYDVTLVDKNSINLHTFLDSNNVWRWFTVSHDLNVTALNGDIAQTVLNNSCAIRVQSGTATFSAFKTTSLTNNISLNDNQNWWNTIAIPSASNVSIGNQSDIILASSTIGGTLTLNANGRYALSQASGSTITTGSTTTFSGFGSIALGSATEASNVFGNLAIYDINGGGTATIRENDAITQASQTWSDAHYYFTTSNDQAITLSQNNYFRSVNITQVNSGATSAGAVYVKQTGNNLNQTQPWVTHGKTTLESLGGFIYLTNSGNTFGPLQPISTSNAVNSIYAKDWIDSAGTAHDAITDLGITGAWSLGQIDLRAYDSTGTTPTGTIKLANTANVLGDLTLWGGKVTITENDNITDIGSNTSNTGAWRTGATTLNIAGTAPRAITLDNSDNQLGGIAITGGANVTSVLLTENHDVTQSGAWTVGAAPLTLSAYSHAITLTDPGNVMGDITILSKVNTDGTQNLSNVPSSVSITEDDAITQAVAWDFQPGSGTTTPVNLLTSNGQAIVLGAKDNLFGHLTVTQNGTGNGAVSIREVDTAGITQATAWKTTGITTLQTQYAVNLSNADNVLGPVSVNGSSLTPSSVTLTENDDITQATPWTLGLSGGSMAPVTLNAGSHQIVLTHADNQLGDLAISGNPSLVNIRENDAITQFSAWLLGTSPITLATSNDQAITLNKNNVVGGLTITQHNIDATSFGAVLVTEADANGITQSGAWTTHGITTLNAGANPIGLTQTGNVLADIAITGAPTAVSITENDAITQNTVWALGTAPVSLATSNAQAIVLGGQDNVFGPLTIAQNGTGTGAVQIKEKDAANGITQGNAWLTQGATTLDSSGYGINLANKDNVFGPLQLMGGTANGTSVTLWAKQTAGHEAITDVGAAGAWTTGTTTLHAYATDGSNLGGGNINLTNSNNALGDLNLKGSTVTITDNSTITDGTEGWQTSGVTTLNPGANVVLLNSVLNTLGDIAIDSATTGVTLTEADNITQASAWNLAAVPVKLTATGNSVLLNQVANVLGDLTITAQDVTVVENDAITDGAAWTVPGLTSLSAGNNVISLNATGPKSDFGSVRIVSATDVDIMDANAIVIDGANVTGTLTINAAGAITQSAAISAATLELFGVGASANLNSVDNHVTTLSATFTGTGGALQYTDADGLALSQVVVQGNAVALSSVAGTVTGLNTISSSTSSLTIDTGAALTVPAMNIAGTQSYTAGATGITLDGNLASTASGAIDFHSPATLNRDLSLKSTDSPITFGSTVAGATKTLSINAGSSAITFNGAVSNLGNSATSNAALSVTATAGATIFNSTLGANNGLLVSGPSTFKDSVTLANGGMGSTFTGEVTLGKLGGMNLSGFKYLTFNSGVALATGDATISTNGYPMNFDGGSIHGPFALTLNAGTVPNATIVGTLGLSAVGTDLTGLSVTAYNPTIPSGGLSIAGPQTYTAASGRVIELAGNVTSTAVGAITFKSPVNLTTASSVTSVDSLIDFQSTVDGAKVLTLNSGTAATTFAAAVGLTTPLGATLGGAALVLQGSGATSFASTVATRSGITASGTVSFAGDVTLGNGDTGSTFGGRVSTAAPTATISGYDGLTFNGGLTLGADLAVTSNGSTIAFGNTVLGAHQLVLNALAAGVGTVTGLDQIGYNAPLTKLSVTAQTLSLPASGLAVAGPMDFSASGGITLNGAVGNSATPATGQIDFNGPVNLASGPVTVTTNNAPVNFASSVDGAQALTVNAGTNTTSFVAAVGTTASLLSLSTGAGGSTALNGGLVKTSGAQTYNAALNLGANTTLTSESSGDIIFGAALNHWGLIPRPLGRNGILGG
jgi:hypothetical protein